MAAAVTESAAVQRFSRCVIDTVAGARDKADRALSELDIHILLTALMVAPTATFLLLRTARRSQDDTAPLLGCTGASSTDPHFEGGGRRTSRLEGKVVVAAAVTVAVTAAVTATGRFGTPDQVPDLVPLLTAVAGARSDGRLITRRRPRSGAAAHH
jgi:hypothetical protein